MIYIFLEIFRDFWARQRRLTQPMFHQRRITAYRETMVACTKRLLQTVSNHPIEPLPSITLRPKYGIKMTLTKR